MKPEWKILLFMLQNNKIYRGDVALYHKASFLGMKLQKSFLDGLLFDIPLQKSNLSSHT